MATAFDYILKEVRDNPATDTYVITGFQLYNLKVYFEEARLQGRVDVHVQQIAEAVEAHELLRYC